MVDVDATEREQDLGRHADRPEVADRAQQREVGVVVGVAAELGRVGEEPDLSQAGDERRIELGAFGQLVEGVLAPGQR